MLIVLPFYAGDAKLAKRLLRWIRDLGGVKAHSCLLVADFDTPVEDAQACQSIAAEAFAAVDLISNDEPVTGWIPGSNSLFKTAAIACECCGNKVPDYLHDLNAMRDAAMHLRVSSPLTYIHYAVELTKIVAKFNSDLENDHAISDHDASAAQRAEALLKTIGKWTT